MSPRTTQPGHTPIEWRRQTPGALERALTDAGARNVGIWIGVSAHYRPIRAIVAQEPLGPSGVLRWHASISVEGRYPTWDEIADARYTLLPTDILVAMLLPPPDQYVNAHPTTFHLHEIRGDNL